MLKVKIIELPHLSHTTKDDLQNKCCQMNYTLAQQWAKPATLPLREMQDFLNPLKGHVETCERVGAKLLLEVIKPHNGWGHLQEYLGSYLH